jgi:hypothetical protein
MKIIDWLIRILTLLFCGAIYLWAGIKWSQSTGARGGLAFDQGWLLVALLISQSIAIRLGGGMLGRRKWLRLIPASLVGFALEGLSDHLFLRLKDQPSKNLAVAFAVFASLFLVNVVAWIVVFPYEGIFGPFAARGAQLWQRQVRFMGILVATICICGAGWSFHKVGIPISITISELQAWFYKAALLVYVFLAFRIFFPLFGTRLRQSPPWS